MWKEIKGYDGEYFISKEGIIMSLPRRGVGSNAIYRRGTKMVSRGNKEYRAIILYKNCKQKRFLIHRLVASHFVDNPENKSQVNHIDNNGLNNFVENLEWVTPKENIRKAIESGSFDNYYKNHHWKK